MSPLMFVLLVLGGTCLLPIHDNAPQSRHGGSVEYWAQAPLLPERLKPWVVSHGVERRQRADEMLGQISRAWSHVECLERPRGVPEAQ